jgi:uncharacterized protein YabN with tetrapyrrole methylase and pyrophosphatase domain
VGRNKKRGKKEGGGLSVGTARGLPRPYARPQGNGDQVLEKLNEELNEFRQALSARDAKSIEEELGDLIFALVNISRFVEVNPEEALRKTIGRFINRFHYIEKRLEEEGKELSGTPLEEMERLWNEAKSCGRQLEK